MDFRTLIAGLTGQSWLAPKQSANSALAQARAAGPAIPFEMPGANMFGPGISQSQVDDDTLLREAGGLPDVAARAIANRLSSLVPEVKTVRRVTDGTTVDEILDDHPLAMLIKRPHPNHTWRNLMRMAGHLIVTTGESYLLKVGDGFGVPRELHPMAAGSTKPLVKLGVVTGYAVTDGNGRQYTIPADTVIRFYFPDPANPWLARGYLGPNGVMADLHKFSTQHMRRHYQFNATPKMVLEPQEGAEPFTPDNIARFEQKFSTKFNTRTGQAEGTPFIIPTFYKLIELAMNTGADIAPLLQYADDYILKAYGVPNSVLGRVVSGDRSSAETNQFVFDMHTIQPIAEMIADALTLQLAADFDESLIVCFADFVSQDKEFELKRQAHRIEHAIDTINDVREEEGDDLVEWGDTPIIASKLGPYDPAIALEAMKNPLPAPGVANGATESMDGGETPEEERAAHIRIRQQYAARRKRRAA